MHKYHQSTYQSLYYFSLAISQLDYHKQQEFFQLLINNCKGKQPSEINSKVVIAKDLDGVIGVDQNLYWKAPNDLKQFFKHTVGTITLAGNNTFLSLPKKEGKVIPLKKRFNLVLSRNALAYYLDPASLNSKLAYYPNVFYAQSLEQATVVVKLLNIFALAGENLEIEEGIYQTLDSVALTAEGEYSSELDLCKENLACNLSYDLKQILAYIEKENISCRQVSVIGGQSLLKLFDLVNPDPKVLKITELVLTTLGIRLTPEQVKQSKSIVYFDLDLTKFKVAREENFFADNEEQIPAKIEYYTSAD